MKPDATLARGVPAEFVLAHTADAAIAVTGLRAYPAGFELTLTAVVRNERVGRMFEPGWHYVFKRFPDEPLPDEFLRFGMQFADGRVATNLARHAIPARESDPADPILWPDGGGGGGQRYDMRYWVWPLPPDGPLTFLCQWPAVNVPESRTSINARLILDAAARAIPLWPEDGPRSRATE